MNNYNVVWILVDSVRTYYTDDDRSRIKIMDKFAEDALEFTNVITSAPSTVMSVSSMMTSIPACYLGRNYNEFRFDRNFFSSLPSILKDHGWNSQAIVMVPDIREKLTVLDLLDRKYWPKNYSHKDDWSNKDIYKILKNALKIFSNQNSKKPYFWFLDFNCRQDPETSNIVEDSIKLLNENGFNKDNTIFVLCSDHGYPDPQSGITPEILKQKKLTHDMFMTDDNIMIPLIFSYPGCKKNTKFNNLSSSLDIMPTILEILGIKISDNVKKQWFGESRFKIIKETSDIKADQERKVRVDARFLGQNGRVTAIRNNKNKLLYFHDKKKFELFAIGNSHLDEKRIKIEENKKIYEDLKNEFKKSEEAAIKFQVNYSIHKLTKKLKKLKDIKSILILHNNQSMSDVLDNTLSKLYTDAKVSILNFNEIKSVSEINFDLLFVFDDGVEKNISQIISKVKFKDKFYIDINMNISIKSGMLMRFIKTIYYNRKFYLQEPMLIFWKIGRVIKVIFKKIK